MKVYLVSGETSGDQHAADLIHSIKKIHPEAQIRGVGGDASKAAGMSMLMHQSKMSVMGFAEVIAKLNSLRKILKQIKEDMKAFKPDKVILVDFPGMNLRLAAFAKSQDWEVHYYIAPKVWAWKESRIKKLKKHIDKLYSILPFEQDYFKAKGIDSIYVGNPSKQRVDDYLQEHSKSSTHIALLPGSRKQEIRRNLVPMLHWALRHPSENFVLSIAPGFTLSDFPELPNNVAVEHNMYALLKDAKFALVTSGTATLETALFHVPQIVGYRTSKLTYLIARSLVKIPYISLVNLICQKAVVPELIQDEFNAETIEQHYASLMQDEAEVWEKDYGELRAILGHKNPADEIAAHL